MRWLLPQWKQVDSYSPPYIHAITYHFNIKLESCKYCECVCVCVCVCVCTQFIAVGSMTWQSFHCLPQGSCPHQTEAVVSFTKKRQGHCCCTSKVGWQGKEQEVECLMFCKLFDCRKHHESNQQRNILPSLQPWCTRVWAQTDNFPTTALKFLTLSICASRVKHLSVHNHL